jgi:hypothetical protein
MIQSIGADRLMYIVGQRLGSHHVHGTWPSLQLHYLEEDEEGNLHPRDHDCETHVNQYMMVPLVVLGAIQAFIDFIVEDAEVAATMKGMINQTAKEIQALAEEVSGRDFETAEPV